MSPVTNEIVVEEIDKDFDPEAEIAEEILSNELGDFYSDDDVRLHADAWETTTGRTLKRGYETWKHYRARKKALGPPKAYSMDRATAAEFLEKLQRVEEPTPEQQKRAHEYEDILGRPHTEFSKRAKPEDAEKISLKRFEAIEAERLWPDRLKLVTKERDVQALNLVSLRDEHDEVRRAAQTRILELSIR